MKQWNIGMLNVLESLCAHYHGKKGYANLRPLKNVLLCPIPVLGSNINPRNTKYMSVVKIFTGLGLEQN
jgi:hypothetical protein